MPPMSDKNKKFPHDASYKDFFSHPAMVASLLRDFVHEPFVPEMDLDTLDRLSGVLTADDQDCSDVLWRARLPNLDWCYVALLLEYRGTAAACARSMADFRARANRERSEAAS